MKRLLPVVGLVAAVFAAQVTPAAADPVSAGSASAFATSASVGGTEVIPPTPLSEMSFPPGGEDPQTAIPVDASPLAVSGTFNSDAVVHGTSDVPSALTVVTQEVEGPYNAKGVALVEGLDILLDAAGEGVSLVSADAVRAEAVAVCRGGSMLYSANSEIIDLDIGGNDVPLNAPITELIDAIAGVLDATGLNAVVDVNRNVVTQLDGGGIAVDALVVSVVAEAGPLALVTVGHAEARGVTCDPPDVIPEALPKTGGSADVAVWVATALGALAVGALRLRRRVAVG